MFDLNARMRVLAMMAMSNPILSGAFGVGGAKLPTVRPCDVPTPEQVNERLAKAEAKRIERNAKRLRAAKRGGMEIKQCI